MDQLMLNMSSIASVSYVDGDTIPEDLEEEYFPPNFKEYMLKEQLKSWRFHDDGDFGWVFWSEQDHEIEPTLSLDNCADFNPNVCAILKVRDNIRPALQKLILSPQLTGCLVQFWAATKTLEGRTLLRTQYQPFALGITEDTDSRQQLCEYRMRMCREYNFFYADAESGEEQLGLPGRVFLHEYPESTPDVNYYSKKEYPQLDDAIQCLIKGSWAVPVFEHSSKTCVGVLETVVRYPPHSVFWHDESFLYNMHDIFQEFRLTCLDGYTHCMQCRDGNIKGRTTAFQELDMVLRSVCEIHWLPLAMTWVPCSACNDLPLVLECVNQKATYADYATAEFRKVAKFSHLRKGGLFERVLSSPYTLYCSDITQLSIVEYPFAHYARWCYFSGWFTLCLQRSFSEKEVYIVDFFLPTNGKHDENILTTLSLTLGTMEENFKTFKLASGQQLGEISLVEVMDFWNGKNLPYVQRIQAPRLAPSPELLRIED